MQYTIKERLSQIFIATIVLASVFFGWSYVQGLHHLVHRVSSVWTIFAGIGLLLSGVVFFWLSRQRGQYIGMYLMILALLTGFGALARLVCFIFQ